MITVSQTELRRNMKKYMDAVERGEEVEIWRHGKPVAALVPSCRSSESSKEYWKHVRPMKIEGVSLTKAILEEREEGW